MSHAHLPSDVLRNIAQHIAEDVITGNYDFAREQKIRVVSTVSFGSFAPTSLAWWMFFRVSFLFFICAMVIAGFLTLYPTYAVERFDAMVKARVLKEARSRTRCPVRLDAATARWNVITVRGLVIGNPKDDEDEGDVSSFKSPHLASFREIKIAMRFVSALGRLQRGNLVFGFVTTEIDEIYISGASVFIEDAGTKKNYQIMKSENRMPAKVEEVETAAPASREASASTFFGGFASSLEATQKAIDAQIQEAKKIPGAIGESLQSASSDVTKRLYALVTILDKLQRVQVLNDEELANLSSATIRRAPMVLRLQNLTLADWSLSILSVAETPFQFAHWELNNFLGKPRELAKKVAVGLIQEIINDFHRKIFGGITDGVGAIGSGLLGAGSFVVGGAVGGVTTVGNGLASGFSSGATAVGTGLSNITNAIASTATYKRA